MLAPAKEPLPYTIYRSARWRPPSGLEVGVWRRLRRVALIAAMLSLIPSLVSFASMMAQPSNSSFFINAVEWLRDNGARGLVNSVENYYYSLTAPAKGGPALHALPKQAGAYAALQKQTALQKQKNTVHYYRPAKVKPLVAAGLPGEGVWHATFADGGSRPPVLITSFRPEPTVYPQAVVGVAWIDHTRTTTKIYPGIQQPAVTLPSRGAEEVPVSQRSKLVATFNSGFKLSDDAGGF